MGEVKYVDEVRKFFKESPVVGIASLKKFIPYRDKRYIYLLISNLLKKKEIKRITKGYYTIYDDASLIVFCFKPAYLGLQNAMSFHNLWGQETNPVVITTNNIRRGLRIIFGRNALLKRVPGKYMFGYEYYKYPLENRDIYIPYSDIEKTFVDMVYFKQPLDEETIENFREKIDKKRLGGYLKMYPLKIRKRAMKLLED